VTTYVTSQRSLSGSGSYSAYGVTPVYAEMDAAILFAWRSLLCHFLRIALVCKEGTDNETPTD
jgi:hypothetical protein